MTDQNFPSPTGPYPNGPDAESQEPPKQEKYRASFGYETPPNARIYSDDQVAAGLPEQEGFRVLPFDYGLALVKQFNFPNQSYFAADPKRLVPYVNFLESAPPDWEPPSWMNIDKIVSGYNYMMENFGSDWENWAALDPDDPGAIYLTSLGSPPAQFKLEGESEYEKLYAALYGTEQPETSPFMDTEGGWEDLEPWQQFLLGLSNAQPMTDRPEWTRVTGAAVQGVGGALGGIVLGSIVGVGIGAAAGAATGSVVPGLGTAIGMILGGVAGGVTFYQAYTGKEIPVFNQILSATNIGAEGLERIIGVVYQIATDDEKEVLENIPAAWKASKLHYETHSRVGTWLTNAVSMAAVGAEYGINLVLPEGKEVDLSSGRTAKYDLGEVWYLEKAIAEPMLVEGGVLAGSAMDEVRARIIAGEDFEMIYADFVDRMGYSGTLTDFVAQTILDPLNFVPMLSNQLGEAIGKATGNDALVAAVKSTRGNIVTDMMPMGVQQLFEAATGLKGTQGLLMSLDVYRGYLRGGVYPGVDGGLSTINIADMTPAQKKFARLTDAGEFMELQPTPASADVPKIKNWMTYLTELTPEAKAYTFIDLAHTNMAAILEMAGSDPDGMIKLMRQVAQVDPVTVGQVGEAIIKSPASATISVAMKDFINSGIPANDLAVWEATSNPRTQLVNMAEVLGENPGKLLELIESDPTSVLQRILTAAEGKTDVISLDIAEAIKSGALNADNLQKLMAPFLGDNPAPWHPDEFRTKMVIQMEDHLDDFLVKRYDISKKSWVFRASNAMKSFQSLLVLGFNPLYAVNNWVNNVSTRAAQGVFGMMTPKQIDSFWQRMGVSPANLETGIGMSGDAAGGVGQMTRSAISAAADPGDWISKVQQVGKKVSKLGIFSQIASKIEVAESRQAATIGTMQMWSKLWQEGSGFSRLPAGVEAQLRTISPSLPDMLYSLVRSGMNMDEITTKLYGDSTYRGIEGVVDEAIRRVSPDAPEVARQLLDSTGVKQELGALLDKAKTVQDVNRAYDYMNTKINDVIDQAVANDLIARAEDIRNRVQTEGLAAAMPLWGELWDAFSQRQLLDLVDNGKAAQTADNLRAMGEWDQASRVWASRTAESDQQWARTNANMLQTADGVVKAIDIDSPLGQRYVNQTSQWMDDWGEFFVAKKKVIERYKNGDFAQPGRRGSGWDTAQQLIADLYTQHVETERVSFVNMFETLGELYEQTSHRPAQEVMDWGGRVMDVRDRTTAEITKFREQLSKENLSADQRAAAWTTFNNEILRPLINERRSVTVDGAYDLVAGKPAQDWNRLENVADVVAADMNVKRIRSQADQTLMNQILKADMVMNRTTFESQVRSAFDLGDEQLAGVMALVDAHARVWADANDSSPSAWYAERLAAVVKSGDPDGLNNLLQADGGRGSVDFLEDGRAVIKAFEARDVSTVVHELGHIFRRDLDGTDLDAVAKWGELADGAELTKLQQAFQDGTISETDRARYVAAEEQFANGWERYLADGKAPTPALVTVFKKFTSWLVEIYRSLTGRGAKGTIGTELADTPLNVNLGDEVQVGDTYVKMRDVFDRMLASEGDIVRYKFEQGESQPQWLLDKYMGPEQMVQQAETPSTEWMESVVTEAKKPAGEVQPTDPVAKLALAETEPVFTHADLDKSISEWPEWSRPAAERALYDMVAEMEEGHPGKRVLIRTKDPVTGRSNVTGVMRDPSTYPDWYTRNELWTRQYKGQKGAEGVRLVLDDLRNGVTDGNNKPLYRDVVDILTSRMLDTDELGNSLGYNTFDERYAQLIQFAEDGLASDKAPYDLQRIKSELEKAAYNAQFRQDFEGVDAFIKQTNDMIARIEDRLKNRTYTNVAKANRQNSLGEFIIYDVFQDGHKIAEVPAHYEQTQTVTVGNYKARILGLDPDNARVIVYEVGDQIKYADRGNQNVLYQPAVGDTPVGGTPAPQYEGAMLDEVNSGSLSKLLDQMRAITADDIQNNRSFKMAELPDDLAGEVRKWANGLGEDMAGTKLAATRFGEMQRNAALLDYKKRYGIDNVLQTIFPYEFWLTRSMGEWAKRAVDKPAWLATYARYRQMQEKMEQYGIPSRLKNKMRIPAAYLPDWMGGGIYIDPMKALFPFATFGTPMDLLAQKSDNVYDTAVRNVQAMVSGGIITATQAEQAIKNQDGPIWQQALAEAQATLSDEVGDPMTMASLMMTPAMWWTYPYYMATGQKDKLNPLPITRTGQAIRGLSDGEGIGGFVGNILALPEETLRRKFNMNVYGEWGDYYLDRMLSNMVGDGTITIDEFNKVVSERTGPIFEEATRRVEEELALKMPGSQTAMAIKEGRLGAIPMTLLSTLFPAGILPQGELELRGLKEEYNQAWDSYNAGNISAVNDFYEAHPEYQARLALWDEPEERLRQNLVSQIWDKYTALDDMNKGLVADQLGDAFQYTFLNKDTRDYTAVDVETLAYWAQALGGDVPNTAETADVIDIPLYQQPGLEIYSPEVVKAVEEFQEKRSELFPDYKLQQEMYFALPEDQRRGYLATVPELKKYWDWKNNYYEAVPIVQQWADEQQKRYDSGENLYTTTTASPYAEAVQAYTSSLSPALRSQMLLTWYLGQDVSGGARLLLMQDWEAMGRPGEDFEAWVESVIRDGMGLGQ